MLNWWRKYPLLCEIGNEDIFSRRLVMKRVLFSLCSGLTHQRLKALWVMTCTGLARVVTWSDKCLCSSHTQNTNLTSQTSLSLLWVWAVSLIVWTKSMNSQILCFYGLREALNTWLFLPNLAKFQLLTWHNTVQSPVKNANANIRISFSTERIEEWELNKQQIVGCPCVRPYQMVSRWL